MPFGIGVWELAILLLVALLVFGPKRLPEMGRSLGRGMREFKDSVSGNSRDDDDDDRARELRSSSTESTASASAAPPRERDTADTT
jgi:sec-independent protein translocase protein TatA